MSKVIFASTIPTERSSFAGITQKAASDRKLEFQEVYRENASDLAQVVKEVVEQCPENENVIVVINTNSKNKAGPTIFRSLASLFERSKPASEVFIGSAETFRVDRGYTADPVKDSKSLLAAAEAQERDEGLIGPIYSLHHSCSMDTGLRATSVMTGFLDTIIGLGCKTPVVVETP